jgi:predicted secreted acid phosphatase
MSLFIFIVFLVFIIWLIEKKGLLKQEDFPYKKKDYLLTENERKLFYVLEEYAKQNKLHVFCKVRLEDLLWIPAGTKDRQVWRNRVKSRHIDFVLCDDENIKPILCIELDDSSHKKEERQERDRFIEEVLKKAGLKFIRFPTRHYYDFKEVSQKIRELG